MTSLTHTHTTTNNYESNPIHHHHVCIPLGRNATHTRTDRPLVHNFGRSAAQLERPHHHHPQTHREPCYYQFCAHRSNVAENRSKAIHIQSTHWDAKRRRRISTRQTTGLPRQHGKHHRTNNKRSERKPYSQYDRREWREQVLLRPHPQQQHIRSQQPKGLLLLSPPLHTDPRTARRSIEKRRQHPAHRRNQSRRQQFLVLLPHIQIPERDKETHWQNGKALVAAILWAGCIPCRRIIAF